MADYLLQESGFRIALEDGLGFLLLESSTGVATTDHSTVALLTPPTHSTAYLDLSQLPVVHLDRPAESAVQLCSPVPSVTLGEDPHDEVKLS